MARCVGVAALGVAVLVGCGSARGDDGGVPDVAPAADVAVDQGLPAAEVVTPPATGDGFQPVQIPGDPDPVTGMAPGEIAPQQAHENAQRHVAAAAPVPASQPALPAAPIDSDNQVDPLPDPPEADPPSGCTRPVGPGCGSPPTSCDPTVPKVPGIDNGC